MRPVKKGFVCTDNGISRAGNGAGTSQNKPKQSLMVVKMTVVKMIVVKIISLRAGLGGSLSK